MLNGCSWMGGRLPRRETAGPSSPMLSKCVTMTEPDQRRQVKDPREGGAFTRMFRGAGYLGQGFGFVFSRHPELLKLCLLPLLINLLVFVGVGVGLYFYYGDIVNWIWARPDSWLMRILWYLRYVFIFMLVLLLSYVMFFVVQAILSAPFNDLLSERTEQLAYGTKPPPFSVGYVLKSLGKTVAHEVAKMGIYVAVMAPILLLSVVVTLLSPVFAVIGFYFTAVFFAYDFIDFSMARRLWSFSRKWGALKQNRALTLGFGAALAGALLIPVFGLLCVPMSAVGGTLLFCDLDAVGAFEESKQKSAQAPAGQ